MVLSHAVGIFNWVYEQVQIKNKTSTNSPRDRAAIQLLGALLPEINQRIGRRTNHAAAPTVVIKRPGRAAAIVADQAQN